MSLFVKGVLHQRSSGIKGSLTSKVVSSRVVRGQGKKFCPKIFGTKTFWLFKNIFWCKTRFVKKILTKEIMCQKKLCQKILVKIFFCPKQFWAKKNVGPTFFGYKRSFCPKKFGIKNYYVQKLFGQNYLWSKKSGVPKTLWSKTFWDIKKYGSTLLMLLLN